MSLVPPKKTFSLEGNDGGKLGTAKRGSSTDKYRPLLTYTAASTPVSQTILLHCFQNNCTPSLLYHLCRPILWKWKLKYSRNVSFGTLWCFKRYTHVSLFPHMCLSRINTLTKRSVLDTVYNQSATYFREKIADEMLKRTVMQVQPIAMTLFRQNIQQSKCRAMILFLHMPLFQQQRALKSNRAFISNAFTKTFT